MKLVQVSPGQYVSVSPEALDRARKAFARVAYSKAKVDQIVHASEAVAHVTVLVGSRKKLQAMAGKQALANC